MKIILYIVTAFNTLVTINCLDGFLHPETSIEKYLYGFGFVFMLSGVISGIYQLCVEFNKETSK